MYVFSKKKVTYLADQVGDQAWKCSRHWVEAGRIGDPTGRNVEPCLISYVAIRTLSHFLIYSYFQKGCRKNVHATIPKGNMGYDQYTVPYNCSCRTYFCCFPLALENTFPWPFVSILSNFFEERTTQNHPQCLSGLSRALFPYFFRHLSRSSCIYQRIMTFIPLEGFTNKINRCIFPVSTKLYI